jgi:hypothetical protein
VRRSESIVGTGEPVDGDVFDPVASRFYVRGDFAEVRTSLKAPGYTDRHFE